MIAILSLGLLVRLAEILRTVFLLSNPSSFPLSFFRCHTCTIPEGSLHFPTPAWSPCNIYMHSPLYNFWKSNSVIFILLLRGSRMTQQELYHFCVSNKTTVFTNWIPFIWLWSSLMRYVLIMKTCNSFWSPCKIIFIFLFRSNNSILPRPMWLNG